jgi:hypothetical protein
MSKKLFIIAFATAICGAAHADLVIMDQISGNTFQSGSASQDFESSFNAYDVAVIDNFSTVLGGENLTSVTMFGQVYGGTVGVRSWNNVTAYRVEIYSSSAAATSSLTGDVASQTVAAGAAARTDINAQVALVRIPVSIALMANQSYWLGVIPVMNFSGGNGQVAVNVTSTGTGNPSDKDARQANPGGGFGIAGNNAQIRLSTGAPVDAGYAVTAVPEPGTIAALGLGAAALLRRRNKRSA